MSKNKKLSESEIAEKIRKGDDFRVSTNTDRKRALTVARTIGTDIVTWRVGQTFQIHILSEFEN